MDNQYFQEILNKILRTRLTTWLGLFAIVLLLLAINLVYYIKTKSENGFSIWFLLPFTKNAKPKLSLKEQIALKIIVLFILLAVLVWDIAPIYSDITQQQYIRVYAEYLRPSESTERDGFFFDGFVYITVDGAQQRLELPPNCSEVDFPEGTHTGYVWYSKSSGYILAFELDRDEP